MAGSIYAKNCECGISVITIYRHRKGHFHKARMKAIAQGEKPPDYDEWNRDRSRYE